MQRRVFIGTGLIGSGMAEAALSRGEQVTVWNRSPDKARPLAEHGALVADTLAAAVEGQARVHLTLTSDEAVDAVLEQIASSLSPEAIVIDHSTTSPAGSRYRGPRCENQGIRYLHAPIFMSPKACREATGMILVCGPKELVREVEPELCQMTGKVWDVGEDPDAAATFKLVGNALNLGVLGALADAYAMAARQGVTPQQCQQLLEGFDLRAITLGRGARMAEGDFSPQWTLAMARKDLGLMIDAAGDAVLTVLPALARRMDALVEEGEGERDVAVLGRDAVSGGTE